MRSWSATSRARGGLPRSASSSASSRSTSALVGRCSARRRPCDAHRAQQGEVLRGAGVGVARSPKLAGARFLERGLTRLGSSRSSKKMSRNSASLIVNSKSSSPLPESDASRPEPPAPPPLGFLMWSPATNSLLPGRTKFALAAVARSRRKRGSPMPLLGIETLRPCRCRRRRWPFGDFFIDCALDLRARAAQEALAVAEALALGIEAAVDEMGHGRFPLSRLSRLVDPHVPFDEPAHLTRRVAARKHALDELVVLVLGLLILLGLEADDRQQDPRPA